MRPRLEPASSTHDNRGVSTVRMHTAHAWWCSTRLDTTSSSSAALSRSSLAYMSSFCASKRRAVSSGSLLPGFLALRPVLLHRVCFGILGWTGGRAGRTPSRGTVQAKASERRGRLTREFQLSTRRGLARQRHETWKRSLALRPRKSFPHFPPASDLPPLYVPVHTIYYCAPL